MQHLSPVEICLTTLRQSQRPQLVFLLVQLRVLLELEELYLGEGRRLHLGFKIPLKDLSLTPFQSQSEQHLRFLRLGNYNKRS